MAVSKDLFFTLFLSLSRTLENKYRCLTGRLACQLLRPVELFQAAALTPFFAKTIGCRKKRKVKAHFFLTSERVA
jgi:hypothetical protein